MPDTLNNGARVHCMAIANYLLHLVHIVQRAIYGPIPQTAQAKNGQGVRLKIFLSEICHLGVRCAHGTYSISKLHVSWQPYLIFPVQIMSSLIVQVNNNIHTFLNLARCTQGAILLLNS